MTKNEVMQLLQLSESAIKSNFVRTQKVLAKKGIILTKEGRGEQAIFNVQYEDSFLEYQNIKEYPQYPKISLNNAENLSKNKFNRLQPLYRTSVGKDAYRHVYWVCQCDCGNITVVDARNLKTEKIKSCGCLNQELRSQRTLEDLTGQIFGELTVIKRAYKIGEEKGNVSWLCKCSCGKNTVVKSDALKNKRTQSCGHIGRSKGEYKIMQLLQKANIDFIQEKSFDSCIFPNTNKKARFDFYLFQQNYLIEFDGRQHYYYDSKNSWNTYEYFIKSQQRDQYKNQWCKNNNIPLIRIPYWHYDDLCIEDLLLETTKYLVV